jgi:hypothetical protein
LSAPTATQLEFEALRPTPEEIAHAAEMQCPPRGGVYALRDRASEEVMRTGRGKDLEVREKQHARDPLLSDFLFEPLYRDVYREQRGLEQFVHEQYRPPLNKINPISLSNPNRWNYIYSAEQFVQNLK